MRFLVGIFLVVFFTSCVKKQSSNPVPVIEFNNFDYYKLNGSDKGSITINYEDGDGDIFVGEYNTKSNVVITTYHFDAASGNFYPDSVTVGGTKILVSYAVSVKQPAEGYKGKALKGTMTFPYNEYRLNGSVKIIKHTIIVEDEAGNKSNLITSPVYTLTI